MNNKIQHSQLRTTYFNSDIQGSKIMRKKNKQKNVYIIILYVTF